MAAPEFPFWPPNSSQYTPGGHLILGCHFFDAANVTASSCVDGIHLDADQHLTLGKALVPVVSPILSEQATAART